MREIALEGEKGGEGWGRAGIFGAQYISASHRICLQNEIFVSFHFFFSSCAIIENFYNRVESHSIHAMHGNKNVRHGLSHTVESTRQLDANA